MTMLKNKTVLHATNNNLLMSPKGTNIPGHYRECEEESCLYLIPCPHIRCQEHRTDMAIKDWTVQHIES